MSYSDFDQRFSRRKREVTYVAHRDYAGKFDLKTGFDMFAEAARNEFKRHCRIVNIRVKVAA